MKYIGLDIDGVVLDYVSGFMKYAQSEGIRIGCKPDGVETYCMSNAYPDLDKEQIKGLIEQFSVQEEFSKLSLYPGVIETMEKYSRYKNIKFVAITNAGTSEITKQLRMNNLRHLPFSEIHVLPLRSSKADYLKDFPQGSIYVDDLKIHVDAAKDLGINSILFRQSYNLNDEHIDVVHNWTELDIKLGELI